MLGSGYSAHNRISGAGNDVRPDWLPGRLLQILRQGHATPETLVYHVSGS